MSLPILQRYCQEAGYPLSPDQIASFEAFLDALYTVNETTNLTRVPREEAELRHLVDSVILIPDLPDGARVLDLGTGPGFPAWPLAAARPDLEVVGMDSAGKMTRFLKSQALPNLHVIQARAEEIAEEMEQSFDVVTGRALAPLGIQLELSARFLRLGGIVAPLRTPAERHEAEHLPARRLGLALQRMREAPLPDSEVVRLIPIYEKVAKTPASYPRRWAEIKRSPLTV